MAEPLAVSGVYTIPATEPFADSLAAGLIARAGGDPAALSRMLVLLPTRRAGRAVRDAFLRQSGGRALLLPRLQPLGDVDEDEMLIRGGEEPLLPAAFAATPAIPEVRRRLMLAEMILTKEQAAGVDIRADQAAWLAAELARLLDQVQTERLSFDALAKLVEGDLAVHWQQTVRFLEIVTASWPGILDEKGLADPALRRNQLLEAQAREWRDEPPGFPVIAAGSTGSIPATADLLSVVASLPEGAVVLPGLDTGWLDDGTWAALPPSHPQYGMAKLLERLEIGRDAVRVWEAKPVGTPRHAEVPAARARLIAEAMRPADGLGDGPALSENETDVAMRGVSYIEAPGPREEAGIIALILREALSNAEQGEERPRTAALVTPDRDLARRVSAALKRWKIEIDDSAGTPLDATPPGGFLRLVAQAVSHRLAPVPLVSLLKHPLAAAGLAPDEMRRRARLLERHLLRGPRPGPGLDGLRTRLKEMSREGPHRPAIPETDRERIADLIGRLEGALGALTSALGESEADVPRLLDAHVATAEALAASHEGGGADRLWSGEPGEAAAGFIEGLLDAARDFARIRTSDYPGFFEAMMTGHVVRPRYGAHPRLAILGPLEARLLRPDILVIGGLNEGNWPREIQPDPWMSRPMRDRFGLPRLERRVGLAAHDFQQAFCAPRVVLTRATKVEGTPSVPSRWLLRLETVLRGSGLLDERKPEEERLLWPETRYPALLERLTRPDGDVTPVGRPAPAPPLDARPRSLSVTEIERWMRDPYEIYAKHVLKLVALDALDADPGAADRGSFIHDALEAFVRENPAMAGANALQRLLALGREAFGDALDRPSVWAFWWPRFEAIARWVLDHEAARSGIAERLPEQKGRMVLPAPGGEFTLRGRADRLDRREDGDLAIIDYKTGAVPGAGEIKAGLAPQLALEALIAAEGGFEALGKAETGAMEYWKLTGTRTVAEVSEVKEPDVRIAEARDGLACLIATFDDPETPYAAVPREAAKPAFSDYGLLERIGEWRPGRRRQ